jgi:hypothetical protein
MLCHLIRWMISRAEDRGKPLPGSVQRHIGRCADCRAYALFTASLRSRLSQDMWSFLAAVPDFALSPAGSGSCEDSSRGSAKLRPPRLLFRPLPVAAAALVVAVATLILFRVLPRPASISALEREKALVELKTIMAELGQFEGVIEGAESTLASERAILEQSVLSAVEYLQDRLNIKVEWREMKKRL